MNTPIKTALEEFVSALETAGHSTKEMQIVLPLRTLAALVIELSWHPLTTNNVEPNFYDDEVKVNVFGHVITLKVAG